MQQADRVRSADRGGDTPGNGPSLDESLKIIQQLYNKER